MSLNLSDIETPCILAKEGRYLHEALQLVQERRQDYKGTGRVWIAIEN